jgi:polyisoprenoid-binding protein YceI
MAVSAKSESRPRRLLPEGRWRVDPERSHVAFGVRKLGAGTVRGRFSGARGELVVAGAHASAAGSVRVDGIATGSDERDAHLRAAAFFDAGTYPEIAFASSSIVTGEDGTCRIRGDLTIRDRACEVEFTGGLSGTPGEPALRVQTEIDRRDFGLVWNAAIEATRIVANTVRIELDVRLTPLPA